MLEGNIIIIIIMMLMMIMIIQVLLGYLPVKRKYWEDELRRQR